MQLNEDDAGNSADDANTDDCTEQPASEVSASPVKAKKKRKKKAKDKSSSDAKAVVLYSLCEKDWFSCHTAYFVKCLCQAILAGGGGA